MERLTPAQWDAIVQSLGPDRAEMWRQRAGLEIGDVPAVTGAPVSATPPQGALQGQTKMDEEDTDMAETLAETGGLGGVSANLPSSLKTLRDVYGEYAALPEKLAAQRTQQFQEAQKRLAEAYAGPSTSQRLWALSQALLAPRPYKGFAGTMANISQAFGNIGQQEQAAEQKRKEALFQLQQQYQAGNLEDLTSGLKGRLDIAKAQVAADVAAAKAAKPKSVIIENSVPYEPSTGERVRIPNQAAWAGLSANPTAENYSNFVRNFPRFADKALGIVQAANPSLRVR